MNNRRQGGLDSAFDSITKAILLDNTNWELKYNAGQLLYNMKYLELSLFFMKQALTYNPDNDMIKEGIKAVQIKLDQRKGYQMYGY